MHECGTRIWVRPDGADASRVFGIAVTCASTCWWHIKYNDDAAIVAIENNLVEIDIFIQWKMHQGKLEKHVVFCAIQTNKFIIIY